MKTDKEHTIEELYEKTEALTRRVKDLSAQITDSDRRAAINFKTLQRQVKEKI